MRKKDHRNGMLFWRNPEIKRQLTGYLALSAVLLLAVWLCAGQAAKKESWNVRREICRVALAGTGGALTLAGIFHFAVTARRYGRLAGLSEQVDDFLHSQRDPDFAVQEEGELSILQDEIQKMTVMLKQQADALFREKRYLCDAITDMSHQLRTPLTSLNLIQAMLSEPEISRERREELLYRQKTLLQRIDDLLVILLKMARIDAGVVDFKREQVRLDDLVKKAAEPIWIPVELKEQKITFRGDGQAVFLGDRDWSAEAVGNILKNCMEHTPSGGRIDIFWEENAVYTELRVEDSGPGIAPEDLPHILERFYKGKRQEEAGFGVGLAFARMVIGAQNGVLTAQNRPEGGARFTVRFYKRVI